MQFKVLSSAPSGSGENLIVPTSETLKQEYFLNLAIQHELPLVLVGASGTGKTFISTALIESLSIEKFINNIVNFSARTNVNYTQGKKSLRFIIEIFSYGIESTLGHF